MASTLSTHAAAATPSEPQAEPRAGRVALGGLPDLLGFHLRMANATFYRHFIAAMSKLDLTQKQHAVLEVIASNDGISQSAIAAELGTDRATMLQIVDRLEARGLIQRQRLAHDRRRQALQLTRAGQALLAKAHKVIAEHEAEFVARFAPGELDAFVDALRRIHQRSDATGAE